MFDIVTAEESDAAALAELKAATFREAYAATDSRQQIERHVARVFAEDVIAKELVDPLSTLVWVLDDGWPVGYAKLNAGAAQTESGLDAGLEIEQIYVRGSHQARGVGRLLLNAAKDTARARSLSFLWLGVVEHNTSAIGFYQRHGFEIFGEHEFLFGDVPEVDLLMRLWLVHGSSDPSDVAG